MYKYIKIYEFKQIIKANSEYLKYVRLTRKLNAPASLIKKRNELRKLTTDPDWIRYQHIAYCLLRGKTYEQIEKPRPEHALSNSNWKYINQLVEKYTDIITNEVADVKQ